MEEEIYGNGGIREKQLGKNFKEELYGKVSV